MLVSGLWKLAAMAGVIGVGLVAVYQAQQGMDKSSVSQSQDESDANATDPFADPQAQAATSSTDDATSADPFAEFPPKQAVNQPLKAPGDSGTSDEPNPFESFSAKSASTAQKSREGLDFGNDDTATETTESADIKIQSAGFNDNKPANSGKPAKLPDDLDAFEAEILKSADKSAGEASAEKKSADKPNQQRQGISFEEDVQYFPSAPAAKQAPVKPKVAEAADPFEVGEPSLAAPKPLPAPSDETGTPDSRKPRDSVDPFAPDPAPAPAVGRTKPVTEPTLGAAVQLGTPVQQTNGTATPPDVELSSPFSPAEDPLKQLKSEPDLATPPENSRRSAPRLPTEVLDPFDSAAPEVPSSPKELPKQLPGLNDFPSEPPEANPSKAPRLLPERNTAPDRNTKPPRNPADDSPKLIDNDLIGDGVIDRASPRGVQQARVTIEKVAPQQATLGEPLVYSVIIKNIGPVDAHHVVVEDRIPKGTELTGTAPRAEWDEKTKKLIWKIGTLKASEEKKISIRVIPRQEGSIGSVARVNFATEVAAEILVAAPQLSFNVKAPRQVRMGDSIELTFLLKNTGNAAASNVTVRDLVPDGLKHEAASDIECPVGKLGPNESREIVLTVTAVKPGKAVNRAILSGDGGITQELDTAIEVIGEQLVLTRSGQTKIYVDRPVQFTNNVRNDGNAEVKVVRVSEVIPAGMDFVAASDGGRFDPAQRAIHWELASLPPGAEAAVSSKLIARSPGIQQAKISASGPAGSTAVIKSDVDVVGRPELQIETVGRTGVVAVGDRLTSKIQLKNHGSASARNVGLSIRLPRELKLLEVSGSEYTFRDNVITFQSVAAIAPREAAGFELVMEAIAEADAQVNLEISADHLSKPARRSETVQIAAEVR